VARKEREVELAAGRGRFCVGKVEVALPGWMRGAMVHLVANEVVVFVQLKSVVV
jgi:hypothetical protein